MKLAEAITEADKLEHQVKLLNRAITDDRKTVGMEMADAIRSLILAQNRKRDLLIAISITEHSYRIHDIPLAAFKIRAASLKEVAEQISERDPVKAQELLNEAYEILKVYQASTWLLDLSSLA